MSRTESHHVETRSRDYVRTAIDGHYDNGDALFRELSERDYGVDGVIELSDNGEPTGQIALVQIKGTAQRIVPLKNEALISCSISVSNAKYARQTNIPVILLYVSTSKPQVFYYLSINRAVEEIDNEKIENQKSITVHIPMENNELEGIEPLFEIIRNFYRHRRCENETTDM